jgi:hypothetical protein
MTNNAGYGGYEIWLFLSLNGIDEDLKCWGGNYKIGETFEAGGTEPCFCKDLELYDGHLRRLSAGLDQSMTGLLDCMDNQS